MPIVRSCSRLVHLALLAGACAHDPLTDAGGSSSGDDIGPPTVVDNGCPADPDSRFIIRLKEGVSCDELRLEEFGLVELEAGFCATKLPTSQDAWPAEIAAAEPLCDNVRAQGGFECVSDLQETYMAGIGGQFHRTAWSEVSSANFTAPVKVAILDTAESPIPACEKPGEHACGVERAFLVGAGTDGGQQAQHVEVWHYRALGQSDGTGTIEQLHAAITNAIRDEHKVMLLALGWKGKPSEVGVDVIRQTLVRARDAGILVVAAAGNLEELRCGELQVGMLYPAAYALDEPAPDLEIAPLVLPVGALGDDGQTLATALPDGVPPLVAPGNLLWMSTVDSCRFGSGSSIAASYAAGVAALALASAGTQDLCQLNRALYAGAPMTGVEPSLVVCGSTIAGMHPLDARGTLAGLKVAISEEPGHAADSPQGGLWGNNIIAAVKSAPRKNSFVQTCTGNYWGPPKIDNITFVNQCSTDGEPRPGDGSSGPAPSIRVLPEVPVKGCLFCAVFPPDDPSVLQVVLKPDFSALIDEITSDEREAMTAWLVLESSVEPGISTFDVSSEPVITVEHTANGGIWTTVGGRELETRAVVIAPVPDGVMREGIRVWLRYDYGTGRPSRWESLGYPMRGVPGLADDEFLTGYCEGQVTCINQGGCEPPRPGRGPGASLPDHD